jgi:hypothetical protein
MLKNLIFLVVSVIAFNSYAATQVLGQNIRLPSQEVFNKLEVTPLTADADAILDGRALAASAATVTSFLAQPDVARNITVTTGGTTADVAAGNVVVTGLNADGQVISETLALTANLAGTVTGAKAFLRVTSVSVPVGDSPFGATIDVGFGTTLGLPRCLDGAGFYIKGLVDGANLTGETLAANATLLESNTVIPNPAPNSSRKFTFLFVQNFRCAE